MVKPKEKHLVFTILTLVILSVGLLVTIWFNIPPADAQDILDEDEVVALAAWGTTQDPNIATLLATQAFSGTNLSLNEVHLGYDKASGALLEDPTISRSTFQITSLSATELKPESDIDPSRIRFGSGFDYFVEPGLAPGLNEQLAKPAISGTSGKAEIPYVVIQFNFPVDLGVKSQLEQNGVVFGDPIDKLSFYAKIPPSALPAVTRAIDAGQVHFVGASPPEARVAHSLKLKIIETPHETLPITVQLFESPTSEQLEVLRGFITITQVSDGRPVHLVSGQLEAAQVLALAQHPLIQWIEEQTLAELGSLEEPSLGQEAHLPPANFEGNLGAGADILKQLGLNGSGINVAVMDTGIARQGSTYHPDLPASRIVDQYYWDPYSDFESIDTLDYHGHGTHIAGTIGGSGAYDSGYSWQGLAPAVNFLIYQLNKNSEGLQVMDFYAALQRGASRNMHIANLSLGGFNGQYLIDARLADQAVRGEFGSRYVNMVIISHNHNALTTTPGTAKNAITVGAVKDGNGPEITYNWEDICSYTDWPPGERVCFSNFGPIDADNDGATRVKPDLVAPGVSIISTWPWYLSPSIDGYYEVLDGTSFAAPQVSGAVALFLDAYSAFVDWPEVVKAALIVSATDVGGTNVAQYGRGMLNIFHAIHDQANISDTSYWTGILTGTGATTNHTFTVPAGFDEVRIALTWADPVAAAGNDNVINDLDVRVYDGSGAWLSSSSTTDDTVEYIKVTDGMPGTWRIEVRAFSLSSAQSYGLATLVMLNKANLSISGFTSAAGGSSSSRDFYLYSILTNNGFAAPGSFVQLQLPNAIDYEVRGARIYTSDGRSHFYSATELHHDQDFRNWDVATGESISGFPKVIRWHVRYAGADCPAAQITLQAHYRDAGATVLGNSTSVSFSCRQSTTYLPLIIK
jgi:subtilisin family serine protease